MKITNDDLYFLKELSFDLQLHLTYGGMNEPLWIKERYLQVLIKTLEEEKAKDDKKLITKIRKRIGK